jgi:thiol-disulfide isomerase/thioredoxin
MLSPQGRAADAMIAPDWTLVAADGQSVRLRHVVSGRTTILLFWATWCPYCKALMPHLQSMRLEYGDEIQVLAINFRDDGDPVAFIKNNGYDFTLLLDGDSVAELYGIWATPGVLIVDHNRAIHFDLRALPPIDLPQKRANHKLKAAHRAPYWAAEIRKRLDTLVAAAKPSLDDGSQ